MPYKSRDEWFASPSLPALCARGPAPLSESFTAELPSAYSPIHLVETPCTGATAPAGRRSLSRMGVPASFSEGLAFSGLTRNSVGTSRCSKSGLAFSANWRMLCIVLSFFLPGSFRDQTAVGHFFAPYHHSSVSCSISFRCIASASFSEHPSLRRSSPISFCRRSRSSRFPQKLSYSSTSCSSQETS